MGWFDLIQFTLLVDDEDAANRERLRLSQAQAGQYAQPQGSMQRI